jgi:protease-4
MGDVAASGGYYISMAADEIITQPGTLTGSIGVVVGKPVFEELMGRAGLTTDRVSEGAHGRMFAPTHPFSDDEWTIVNSWLDQIYADFTGKVASGRSMTGSDVEAVARGRVWTGIDAVGNGLADGLGGLTEAAEAARRRGGLAVDAPLRLFPHVGPLDQLRQRENSEDKAAALPSALPFGGGLPGLAQSGMAAVLGGLPGGLGQLAWPAAGPLMMPGYWRIG